jgi:hypothetical protein
METGEIVDAVAMVLFCCGPYLLVGGLVIALRLLAHPLDIQRIRQYISAQGGELLNAQWAPFATGWLGTRGARLYRIRYRDLNGHEHTATCKTNLLAGVYLSEDEVVQLTSAAPGGRTVDEINRSLYEENRRLKRDVEELQQTLTRYKRQ